MHDPGSSHPLVQPGKQGRVARRNLSQVKAVILFWFVRKAHQQLYSRGLSQGNSQANRKAPQARKHRLLLSELPNKQLSTTNLQR